MPELRWILIVFGAGLLLGIYLWGRRSSRQAAAGEDALLRAPEHSREPHSAYVFRDEVAEDPDVASADEGSVTSDAAIEPIVANRRAWHFDPPAAPDAAEEGTPAAAAPTREKDVRRTRIEPRLGEEEAEGDPSTQRTPEPLEPIREPVTQASAEAPTLSMSNTPPPRRSDRRKIIALRIAATPQRIPGAQLLAAVEAEGLQHGKYDVFHSLDENGSTLFSVASMVEPGTFDPLRMPGESFPGITLFTQFPGPCESMLAFNALVLSARRLQEKLGGTLQDERGVPLTIHRLERLRQDIREFEQGHGRDAGQRAETPSTAPTL